MNIKEKYRIIDLTHPLHEGIPTWTGRCGFRLEMQVDYAEGLRVHTAKHRCGIGTHMDAPSHFIPGGADIDQIPLDQLLAPACVLDLSADMHPGLAVEIEHVEAYVHQYGNIPRGALVIAYTGWGKRWSSPEKYRNADEIGKMRYPGFSEKCAQYLSRMAITGIGIDTLSPDGAHEGFPVHMHILGSGKFILENLANLDLLPPSGSFVLALPVLYRQATEAPTRVIGFIPQ